MPLRKFRAHKELWGPADDKAKRHGVTMSSLLRAALERWIEPPDVAIGDTVRLVGPDTEPGLYEVVDSPDGPTLRKVEE